MAHFPTPLRAFCLATGLFAATAPSASAQNGAGCGLALVLAYDASASVSSAEYKLQTQGLARALADREVMAAILENGGILAMAMEWSGRHQHMIAAPWTFLDSEPTIAAFARKIYETERFTEEFPTAIGFALGYAAIQLSRAPMNCRRKTIDVSGDGVQNEGFQPSSAYRAQDFSQITVNGLVIKGEMPDPEPYYRNEVIHGPAAFVEVARDFLDFENAMKRKLLREIRPQAFSMRHPPAYSINPVEVSFDSLK